MTHDDITHRYLCRCGRPCTEHRPCLDAASSRLGSEHLEHARLLIDTDQQRLVLSQAFAWPAAPGELRGLQQGAVLLRLDLGPTLKAMHTANLQQRVWLLGWLALGALLLLLVRLERIAVRPLHRLRDAALALGAGDLTRQVPPTRAAELQAVGAAFNQMAQGLSDSLGRLADSEQRQRELFAAAPDAMLTVTPDGIVDCQPGDVIVTEIEGIGALTNTIVKA
jgi:HAMP domain-containing protein